MAIERLQKVLAHRGVASRRSCEELILAGRVMVNGAVVTELGTKVDDAADDIAVDGKLIGQPQEPIVVMLNKPPGYTSTVKDVHAEKTIMELVEIPGRRLYPIGRLDKDSRGLILLTDDGELANALLHPKKKVEKIYEVAAWGKIEQEDLQKLINGVELEDGPTLPANILDATIEKDRVKLVIGITEGRKRQVRRMLRAIGAHVSYLRRIEFGGLKLGPLPEASWRRLKPVEIRTLRVMAGLETKSGRRKKA